jgi:hypothetical protein
MKPNPWILPALAVLVTGGWIASRKHSATTLEREITIISERIQQAKAGASGENGEREAAEKARKEKDKAIDWKDVAGKIGQMRGGGMQDMRTMMRMQRLLLDLSAEELCVELDEIAALDIEEPARKQLQGMILGVLSEKDPKLALDRFGDQLGDQESGVHWQLSAALRKWADKEPAAAVAWLDRQIAAGKLESKSLDGRNRSLVQFESSIVGALLKTDPAAATARIKTLPEAQREELLQQGFFFQVAEKNEAAYAKLIRDALVPEKVGPILASTAGNLARQGGFERVDGFIATTHASDDEKKAIVAEVIKNKISPGDLKIEELDKARAWGNGQSPAVVDKATGEALASSLWRGGNFDKASELALKYHESSGNDEVLAAFLKSNEVQHRAAEEALPLIDKIKDPALQEEIRKLPQYQKQAPGP